MRDDQEDHRIGRGYPLGQLAKAFITAFGHEDERTRQRAEERVRRWEQVLAGMATGELTIGSRTPVSGLPAWVTPEVVRGGFATGDAAAEGALLPFELEVARRGGVPADRRAIFAYCLTEPGLAELNHVLDTGQYRVDVPEEAALLTVAWLLRNGDRLRALTLLDDLEPFADRLRFVPRPTQAKPNDPSVVWRETAGEVRDALSRRRPKDRVESMREALTVWNPFADELLSLWLETVEDGRVGKDVSEVWLDRGAGIFERYRALAAAHNKCSKHRKPQENIGILLSALEELVSGRPLNRRQQGLLQHAVDSMVRRRGLPGSEQHTALRMRQSEDASQPTHHSIAQIVVARLNAVPEDAGVRSVDSLVAEVTREEQERSGIPAGSQVPESIQSVVKRALAAPVEELIERRIVPSAEVLARLVPQIAAATTTLAYSDNALRALMAANYRAFRNRRSLLLLNLERQVQIDELPWVRAVVSYRAAGNGTQRQSHAALGRLGELALQAFPATILPNVLIRELDVLATESGLDIPFVEEIAADIFMGTFSEKFLQAAKLAADVLEGTIYDRYYAIDYQTVREIKDAVRHRRFFARTSETFAALCRARAGNPTDRRSVAANGMIIEQSQILTSHNLAALVKIGVAPAPGWSDLARRSFATVSQLVDRIHNNPRPLATIKDAAYAWRQALFFLALISPSEQADFVRWAREQVRAQPKHSAERLNPVIGGLANVLAGREFDVEGIDRDGRRFLGWAVGGHWMQPAKVDTPV